MAADCPSREDLSAYLIGELPDRRADEVALHVETCADCHAAIERLDQPYDKLVLSLRKWLALPAFVVEDVCRRAVARLHEGVPAPWNVESGDIAMPAAPAARLTHLGGYEFVWKLGEGGMGTVYKRGNRVSTAGWPSRSCPPTGWATRGRWPVSSAKSSRWASGIDGNARVAIPDKFRDAIGLTADGKPMTVSRHAVTRLVDWNGDGVFDLLVGDGEGNVWLFRNVGSKTDFRLAPGERVKVGRTELRAGTGNTTACFVDMTGDGKRDLIVAHSDDQVLVCVNQGAAGEPEFDGVAPLSGRDGTEFRLPNGCGARIDVGDWDGDGLPDILAGGYLGSIVLYRNTGTANSPRFEAAGVPLTSQGKAWSEPYDVHPTLVDLNQDGRPDLAYGTNWGYFSYFISDTQPRNRSAFAFPSYPLRLGNLDLRAIAGDDSTPTFGDVNGDGTLDLVSGGAVGKLWLLLGRRQAAEPRAPQGAGKGAP